MASGTDDRISMMTDIGRKTLTIEKMYSVRYECLSDLGGKCLRSFFDTVVPPDQLPQHLRVNFSDLKPHCTQSELTELQRYVENPETAISSRMDTTFLYKVLRNTGVMQKPTNDWGKQIGIDCVTKADDIERIRMHRNAVVHQKYNHYTLDQYDQAIRDLCYAIRRLSEGKLETNLNSILNVGENEAWEMNIKCNFEKGKQASKMEETIFEIFKNIIEDLEKKKTKEDIENVLQKLKIRISKSSSYAHDIVESVRKKVLSWCDKHEDQKDDVILFLLDWTMDIKEDFKQISLQVYRSSIVIHAQVQSLREARRFQEFGPKKIESCLSQLFTKESFLTLFDPPLSDVKFSLSHQEMITITDFSGEEEDIREKILEVLSTRVEGRNFQKREGDEEFEEEEKEQRGEKRKIEEERKKHEEEELKQYEEKKQQVEERKRLEETKKLEQEKQESLELLESTLNAYEEVNRFFKKTWKPEREKVISDLRSIRDNIQHDEQVHRAGSAFYSAAGMTGAGMVLTGIASVLTGGFSLPLIVGGAAAATTSGIASTSHMKVKLERTRENCLKAQNILQKHSRNSENLYFLIKEFHLKSEAVIKSKGSYSFEEYVQITGLPSQYEGSIQRAIRILTLGGEIEQLLDDAMAHFKSTLQDVLSMLTQLFNVLGMVENLVKLTSGDLSEHAQRIQQCIVQLEQELRECSKSFER